MRIIRSMQYTTIIIILMMIMTVIIMIKQQLFLRLIEGVVIVCFPTRTGVVSYFQLYLQFMIFFTTDRSPLSIVTADTVHSPLTSSPLSSIHHRIPLSLSRTVSRRATPTVQWRPPFTSPSTSATARLAASAGSVGWPTANRKAPRSVSRSAPAKQAGPVISLRPTPETATAICCGRCNRNYNVQ